VYQDENRSDNGNKEGIGMNAQNDIEPQKMSAISEIEDFHLRNLFHNAYLDFKS
jgi:hypothetical protein